MTVHNYRSRQVHETLNGVHPSSGFRDMRSAKSGLNLWQIWQVFGPWASPYGANDHGSAQLEDKTIPQNFEWRKSVKRLQRLWVPQVWQPPAQSPARIVTIPSSPEGWGVKSELSVKMVYFTRNTFCHDAVNFQSANTKTSDVRRVVKYTDDLRSPWRLYLPGIPKVKVGGIN